MDVKLIAFDCDGTLVDSQSFIVDAMIKAFQSLDIAAPSVEAARAIIGLSLTEAVKKLAPMCEGAQLKAINHAYVQHFARLREDKGYSEPFYDGAMAAIEKLSANDHILMGMCTGKSRMGVNKIIAVKGLEPFMATTQAGDEHPSKPHPAMLEAAMIHTGVQPYDTVMIGDTTFDMEMGKAAGARTIGVDWGYHSSEALERAGADAIIKNFDQLIPLLQNWNMIHA